MITEMDILFLQEAIALAKEGSEGGLGGPFGCIIVKDGQVVGRGSNRVTSSNDPTAHAEVVAIRDACARLGDYQLNGCDLYTSCEPCPMCLGAIYWARPRRVIYAATRNQAADAGFDDDFIYREISLPFEERRIPFDLCSQKEAADLFGHWKGKEGKKLY
jgi:guanine deaminase